MSGADLANLVNEAALFAARSSKRLVDMHDFERAKDKIIMGAERRSIVMPEEERRNTAYHESGHAIVATLLPKTDPVHKVTIIPRGRALGVTMQLPEADRYSMDRNHMLNMIAVLFGGRIAEELFMNQMTTGASNDFERATEIARNMVTRYGMSDELGPMVYGENEGEVFLGRSVTTQKNVSESTMQKVDEEIRKIIDSQYAVARKLLEDNRDKVEAMAKALLELETIDADQIADIMAGRPRAPAAAHAAVVGSVVGRHGGRPGRGAVGQSRVDELRGGNGPRAAGPSLNFRPRCLMSAHLHCGTHRLDLSRPRVMGILNVTPDSFADGGRYFDLELALTHARRMLADGADIIDVGGESTRPGAAAVSERTEIARVIPVIEALAARERRSSASTR